MYIDKDVLTKARAVALGYYPKETLYLFIDKKKPCVDQKCPIQQEVTHPHK